ncbi:MAG: hypothetical protein OZ921_11345 [Sorangiineae bacterium]|nr:hypothetical protein [Polyangiaceae bacterium]MEB2323100.1 hypothetical protein [Sorangiineae bacterium]
MRTLRALGAGLWLTAALSVAPPVRAQVPRPAAPAADPVSDEAALARATSLYEAGHYAECAESLGGLLDPKSSSRLSDPGLIEVARVYQAACLIGSGHPGEADDPLRQAIRANPQMRAPDSLVFPPEVVDRFMRVRETLLGEIRKADEERIRRAEAEAARTRASEEARKRRVEELKRYAAEETVTTRNRRWIAAIPFGVGQFQNGDAGLGWAFLASEVALGGTAFGAMVLRSYYHEQAFDSGKSSVKEERDRNAQTVLIVTGWAFVGVAALGIAQSQLAFVPEFRETRRRALPREFEEVSRVRVAPSFAVDREGAALGLTGTF